MPRLRNAALLVTLVSAVAPAAVDASWEHLRVIGQRLGIPRVVTFGASPAQAVAVADVDGDGHTDIIVATAGVPYVSVFLGDASRPFTSTIRARGSDWVTVDAELTIEGIPYRTHSGVLSMTTI